MKGKITLASIKIYLLKSNFIVLSCDAFSSYLLLSKNELTATSVECTFSKLLQMDYDFPTKTLMEFKQDKNNTTCWRLKSGEWLLITLLILKTNLFVYDDQNVVLLNNMRVHKKLINF